MNKFFAIQIHDDNFVRVVPVAREFTAERGDRAVAYHHAANADSVVAGWADIDTDLTKRLLEWLTKELNLRAKETECTTQKQPV